MDKVTGRQFGDLIKRFGMTHKGAAAILGYKPNAITQKVMGKGKIRASDIYALCWVHMHGTGDPLAPVNAESQSSP